MTYTINLSPSAEKRLHERASAHGLDVAVCLNQLVEDALATQPAVDQLLAPIRRQYQESGMTDDELDALVEEVREDIWQEQRAEKNP